MKENHNHFFAYIGRMRFINRWALMRNSYTENIQEHSAARKALQNNTSLYLILPGMTRPVGRKIERKPV